MEHESIADKRLEFNAGMSCLKMISEFREFPNKLRCRFFRMTIKEIQEKTLKHTQTPPREPTIIVDGTKEEKKVQVHHKPQSEVE
jgi:hypothetical protein